MGMTLFGDSSSTPVPGADRWSMGLFLARPLHLSEWVPISVPRLVRDHNFVDRTKSATVLASQKTSFAEAARPEALKWALFVTMIVFTTTLRDRYADVLICLSILVSTLLNGRLNPKLFGWTRSLRHAKT
jgi:hypothetical protein